MPANILQKTAFRFVFAMLLALFLVNACASDDYDPRREASGCTKDTDCNGDQICEEGHCIDPKDGNSDGGEPDGDESDGDTDGGKIDGDDPPDGDFNTDGDIILDGDLDENPDLCDPDPCHGLGECNSEDGSCDCEHEHMTTNCGACVNPYTNYPLCNHCLQGYIDYPECRNDPCDPDPCNGHGTCSPSDGSCSCDNEHMTADCRACEEGYTGYPNCALDYSTLGWQNPPADSLMDWDDAKDYCSNLSLDGHSDWRLPTISELRSLIRGCPGTVTGGTCGVTDSCTNSSCHDNDCLACGLAADCYWPDEMEGLCHWYWSSSPVEDRDDLAWFVSFSDGYVIENDISWGFSIRCVRDTATDPMARGMFCETLPSASIGYAFMCVYIGAVELKANAEACSACSDLPAGEATTIDLTDCNGSSLIGGAQALDALNENEHYAYVLVQDGQSARLIILTLDTSQATCDQVTYQDILDNLGKKKYPMLIDEIPVWFD